MNISAIEMSDFDLVFLKNNTPHCHHHGAMNKITSHEDGGGVWRCITTNGCVVKVFDNQGGMRDSESSWGLKQIDGICRAGCEEIISLPNTSAANP